MEYLKQVYNDSEENSHCYSVVDVYNKKKYYVKKYLNFLIELNQDVFHLAECPIFPSPILVDVDIKKAGENPVTLYNEEMIEEIITCYTSILNEKLLKKPNDYKILFLEKEPRVEDGFIKHGFHLHFISISLNKDDLKYLFENVKKISKYSSFIDDVSSKPWLMYGATKSPGHSPYKITKAYIVKNNEISCIKNYKEIFIGQNFFDIKIDYNNLEKMMKAIMSIKCIKNFSLQVPNKLLKDEEIVDSKNQKLNILNEPRNNHVNIPDEKIGEIVMSLKAKRAVDYNEWIKVAMILTTIAKNRDTDSANFFKGIFHLFSKKSDDYNEISCDQKWDSLMKSYYDGGLGIGTLIYYAKEDGNYSFDNFGFNFSTQKISSNDYDISNMVKESITELYMTHKEYGCYKFESSVWKEVSGWDGVFKKHINNWFKIYKKEITQEFNKMEDSAKTQTLKDIFQKLEKKIKSYSGLNNISKSLFDLYFNEEIDSLFVQKRNIAFKNCVLDVLNWKIVQGNPDLFFINRIEHDLVPWDEVPEDKKFFVLDFFEKLFPDEELRKYNVINFARFLTGKNNFKQFQFWTGDGNNGKSACITLMEHIFGKFCMKIPKSMITGVVQKQGGANPELFRLKNARIAIIDEITENDYLDPGQIKGLTGNDRLYGRDLYQRSKDINEITPMFFPILITNEVPIIKKPDDATWGRIRLINFESTFTHDVEKYKKNFPTKKYVYKIDPRMHDLLEENAKYFLSYFIDILFSCHSFDEFNKEEILPEKVIEGLEKFKEGQNILRKFLEENFIVNENSTEIFSYTKILKEYNSSRPKVTLTLQEVEKAMESYSKYNTKIKISGQIIKGLSRVEF